LLALAIVVALLACGPRWSAPQQPEELPDIAGAMIRTEARHSSSIPPLRLDIEEAEAEGVDSGPNPRIVSARVRWRTLFNIPYGVTIINDRSSHTEWHHRRMFGSWAGFIAGELLLLGAASWLVLRESP
jgi:hypothetical protein